MKRKALIVIAVLLFAGFLCRDLIGQKLSEISVENAARRQINYICMAIKERMTTADDVCSHPLPEIDALQFHFQRIRESDGEWFRSHGWKYYPTVRCGSGQPIYDFMDRSFVCDGTESTEVPSPTPFPTPTPTPAPLTGSLLKWDLPEWIETARAQTPPTPATGNELKSKRERVSLDYSQVQSSGDRVSFGHSVILSPVASLPAFVSFVNSSDVPITRVRALLLLDGELLAAPLRYHTQAQAFRGRFPTPQKAGSYRFQITLRSGRSIVTEPFALHLECRSEFDPPQNSTSAALKEALDLQAQSERLHYALDAVSRMTRGGP
ncbi:MAG: hypothetical protein IT290_03780 [Deltaproteobacteria bacterium]|nr:hypothetical protein [Deltaproteobacteria bacterium]